MSVQTPVYWLLICERMIYSFWSLQITVSLCKDQPNTPLLDLMRRTGVAEVRRVLGEYIHQLKSGLLHSQFRLTNQTMNTPLLTPQSSVRGWSCPAPMDPHYLKLSLTRKKRAKLIRYSTVQRELHRHIIHLSLAVWPLTSQTDQPCLQVFFYPGPLPYLCSDPNVQL